MKREDYQKRIDALNPNVREAYEKYIEEDFQSLLNRTMEGYITPRFLRDALEYCEAVDRARW